MVEWKPLNKIVSSISTGLNPRTNFVLNENDAYLFYVTVKEITSNKVVFSKSTDRITPSAKEIINKRSKLEKGDILFSGIGTIGKVAYVDINTDNWDCSESVFLIKPAESDIKGKYLYYILTSNIAKSQYEKGSAGAIMKGVRKKTLENIKIPIPSLEEQNRIVGILDTFTDSIENLKQQIAQRRKQFEFYRDQLLDLEGKEGVEMKTLGEICDIKGDYGISASSKPFDGNCRYIRITDITDSGSLNDDVVSADYNKPVKEALKEGDILFARTGATVGKTLLFHKEYGECLFAGYLIRYRVKTMIVLPKFVFHFAHSNDYYKWVKANLVEGAQPNISALKYNSLQIPVPPPPEQSRIVSILDTFEASISNLEAQLEQRQKQYEYYRNQLLTFE